MTPQEVADRASKHAFGEPLVVNNLRAIIVETIVESVLPDWTWCSKDWAAWDFEHPDGIRLEVKQAAAKQTWATTKPRRPTFDIRPRTGRYEGTTWISSPSPERFADLYLFAFHPRDDMTADQRDPMQWEFYVVPAAKLPAKNAWSLSDVRAAAPVVTYDELSAHVEAAKATHLGTLKTARANTGSPETQ